MPYRAAKISFDGSHYIATPKENFPQGHKRRRAARLLSVEEVEKKEQFEVAYKESQKLPRKERKTYMRKAMEEAIPDKEQLKEYVERNNERKKTNAIRRKVRLVKKAYLQEWSFFCTFTYRRNVEDTVKMQPSVLSAALPYADVFPAFAGDKMFERISQRFTEAFLRMQLLRLFGAEDRPRVRPDGGKTRAEKVFLPFLGRRLLLPPGRPGKPEVYSGFCSVRSSSPSRDLEYRSRMK